MGILQWTTDVAGQVNCNPRRIKIVTTDNLATVTAAGYLNLQGQVFEGFSFYKTDIIDMIYSYSQSTQSGTYEAFIPSIASNGQITLSLWANAGDVLLPVVSGDFAVFNGTTGQIKDAGYLPSNAAKTNVVMANAATTANGLVAFADTAGTVKDPSTTSTIGFGITAATGNLAATTGNLIAGSSGHAGNVQSFPGTAANGSFVMAAVNNSNNHVATLSNSAVNQDTVYTFPDPAGATGNVAVAPSALVSGNLVKASGTAGLIVDQGVAMKSVAQAVVAGGAAAQTVTDAFCTSASCVIASWNDTSNAVQIKTVAAGNGSFVVTSTADPGASHLNYVIFK